MGMYDVIFVKRKLPLSKELKKAFPDTDWALEEFQTKDLENTLTAYTIKGTSLYWDKVDGEYVRVTTEEEENKLRRAKRFCWPYKFVETSRKQVKHEFHGTINFYHYKDDKDNNTWDIEFNATFNKGKLTGIELIKGEISSTAEENAERERAWQETVNAHERHPWTKTKRFLNKITFNYWSKFWGNKVSRVLYWIAQKTQKLQMWVIRTLA
jgi:hypothetical protein